MHSFRLSQFSPRSGSSFRFFCFFSFFSPNLLVYQLLVIYRLLVIYQLLIINLSLVIFRIFQYSSVNQFIYHQFIYIIFVCLSMLFGSVSSFCYWLFHFHFQFYWSSVQFFHFVTGFSILLVVGSGFSILLVVGLVVIGFSILLVVGSVSSFCYWCVLGRQALCILCLNNVIHTQSFLRYHFSLFMILNNLMHVLCLLQSGNSFYFRF